MDLKRLLKPNPHRKFRRALEIIEKHFDYEFYKNNNPDLSGVKHDLAIHYLQYGSAEGRRPTPDFDPHYYARTYSSEIGEQDPFVHYVTAGRALNYRGSSIGYLYSELLAYPDGIVPSLRPRNEDDFALASPLPVELRNFSFERAAAIVHAFYPELISDIFDRLEKSPCPIDVYISTDSIKKAELIRQLGSSFKGGKIDVRVLENRGRDIGPMLFGFQDVFDEYEVFLHLHTKQSPHGGDALEPWRDYLYDNLVGSAEIISTNLSLLEIDRIGFVFPQHLYALRGILNWGFDFENAAKILEKCNIKLSTDMVLEFPSGTMFWARTAAFKPLLHLGLKPQSFDPEAGQVDGTLAHAIERSLLFVAESAGFTWAKVLADKFKYPHPNTVLHVESHQELMEAIGKVYRPLSSIVMAERYPLSRNISETRDILYSPSFNSRTRFVLFVPSINARQIFGGISTALHIFREMMSLLADSVDFCIVVTDAVIESNSFKNFPEFIPQSIGKIDIGPGNVIVDAFQREGLHFQTRANDIYFATAWWTANFAKMGQSFQERFFRKKRKFIYLIQDFEPDFYGWSPSYALAENTYRESEDFIAIINSEELHKFFYESEYQIKKSYCLPYKINSRIDKMLSPARREKIILFYGRPSVKRNAFEIVCNGLAIWQTRNPSEASTWRIISVGEEYPKEWTSPLNNITVLGKLTLEQYAYWLNRSSVGISLMISPHPSYPPLEMAEAGLMTITNNYTGKDMRKRFDVEALPYLSPDLLAKSIEKCVNRYQSGSYSTASGRATPKALDTTNIDFYSAKDIADEYGLLPKS